MLWLLLYINERFKTGSKLYSRWQLAGANSKKKSYILSEGWGWITAKRPKAKHSGVHGPLREYGAAAGESGIRVATENTRLY